MERESKKEKYDPIKKAEAIAQVVCRDDLRKYYRFRPARFYGGIATADCLGCCLSCIFCWSWEKVVSPEASGHFFGPQEVARQLTGIARKKKFQQVRISGNEPTIARVHLIKVLEQIPGHLQFILETNGILIGHDQSYAEDLARFENLYVRVSLKGTNEEEFSFLTGATPEGFFLQLKALENLVRTGVKVHPAAMLSFSSAENVRSLKKILGEIDRDFADFEVEELVLYGDVEERLQKAGVVPKTASRPDNISPVQV